MLFNAILAGDYCHYQLDNEDVHLLKFGCAFFSKGKENANHEERLRLIREKHDEERQRKLEELKQQVISY